MFNLFAENWLLMILRGILAIIFGFLALIWPEITLAVLIILFGIYVILEGILALAASFRRRMDKYWWVLFLEGIAGIGVGLFAFIWPSLTAIILIIFIAVWAVLTGILEIVASIQLHKEISGGVVLGIAGVLSILLGILLMLNPGVGILAVVWLIGIYAILFGGLLMYLGFISKRYRGVMA